MLPTVASALAALACSPQPSRDMQCVHSIARETPIQRLNVDLELIAPRVLDDPGSEELWNSIGDAHMECGAPESLPLRKPYETGMLRNKFRPKALRVVRLNGQEGVLFLYPIAADYDSGDGIGVALVNYDARGQPVSAVLLASIMRFEGQGVVRSSSVVGNSIETCETELEFFTHDGSGNIQDRLESSSRGVMECRVANAALSDGS